MCDEVADECAIGPKKPRTVRERAVSRRAFLQVQLTEVTAFLTYLEANPHLEAFAEAANRI